MYSFDEALEEEDEEDEDDEGMDTSHTHEPLSPTPSDSRVGVSAHVASTRPASTGAPSPGSRHSHAPTARSFSRHHSRRSGSWSAPHRPAEVDLGATREREVSALTIPVLLLLRGLSLLQPAVAFYRHASWLFPCLADLVVVRSSEVRESVRDLLAVRFAPALMAALTTGDARDACSDDSGDGEADDGGA